MKLTYTLIFIIINIGIIILRNNNSSEDVFIILDAIEITDLATATEGIYKYINNNYDRDIENYPSIGFYLISQNRDIKERFKHFGYDLVKLSERRKIKDKDNLEIKTVPVSFLTSTNMIDLNTLFTTLTKASAKSFMNNLRDKKVYIIDRNDITSETVKLIQVRVASSSIPYDTIKIIE